MYVHSLQLIHPSTFTPHTCNLNMMSVKHHNIRIPYLTHFILILLMS